MRKELTENHIRMAVGMRVTFPGQQTAKGLESFGVLTEILGRVVMENMYRVQGDSGAEYVFKGNERVMPAPQPGFPVTFACWTDNWPATVMSVKGKKMTVRRDEWESAARPGEGGPGGLDANKWTLFEGDSNFTEEYRLNKKGQWVSKGYVAIVGTRRYHYDYHI